MLHNRRMLFNLYSDTMFSPKVPSAQAYMMVQIFVTDFGWSQNYAKSCKSQAHDALCLLFAWEGVPPKRIVDGAKEMKLGEFAWICNEATCYLWGTEPYSPWANSTKRKIRELKKGAARKLTRSGDCGALCWSMNHSHTAHDIYQLDGCVPGMVISGETADISPFCEFGFWDWVKFREDNVAFPDDQVVLGKYLGPNIDVEPVVMQHVMKANGKHENRSTLRQLTPEEHMHELARVLCRKHNSTGVPVGTVHKQPAIDTHVYKVLFPDGCTKELATNTIAEALYAQCNPDGNQYIMLDTIMDFRKNPNVAISRNNQVKIDSSTSWQKLLDLKESHPLQVAEFALAAGIADEPAFNWWVSWVLKKRDRIISL
ncbi:hypothetical protein ACHAW6_010619, partial [Cyclotella cf. meneghiniana]